MTETHGATVDRSDGGPARPAWRPGSAIELRGIVKRFPGVVANDGIDLTVRGRLDPRHRRRERRRQVDADEDPLRACSIPTRASSGPGGEVHFKSPTDAIASASAWCTSTSCSPTTSPSPRTSSSATSRRTRRDDSASARPARSTSCPTSTASTSIPTSSSSELGGRRPPAGRDPEGALPGSPHPHPRRADRRPGAPGGRRAVRIIRDLTDEGVTVIFITHKLDEVLTVADAITVIRAGKTVAEIADPRGHRARAGGADGRQRAARRPSTRESDRHRHRHARRLGADGGRGGRRVLDQVSLRVHGGEIVGVAGVDGNGQPELRRGALGPIPSSSGTDRARRRRTSRDACGRPGGRRASGTSPRIDSTTACCSPPRSGRTRCSATRHRSRTSAASGSTAEVRVAAPTRSSRSTTCARRASSRRVRPCRAATSRSWSSAAEMLAQPTLLDRRPPDAGHRRRRAGRGVG